MVNNKAMTRILLITHQPISLESSNGRTLYSYLKCFSKDELCNFYISGSANDLLASSYFCINDRMLIKGFPFRPVGTEQPPVSTKNLDKPSSHPIHKTLFKILCRDLLWRVSNVFNKRLRHWLLENRPDCIVLQASDFPYLADLAAKISKFMNVPIIVQNTEEYLLKDHDFLKHKITKHNSLIFKIYRWRLRKSYGFLFKNSPTVHLTKELLEAHQKVYPNPQATWIGNSTTLTPSDRRQRKIDKAYYFGNFGVGRAKALNTVAREALAINHNFQLLCYGSAGPNELKELSGPGIVYRCFLPYADLINEVKKNADLLVHAEGEDKFYLLDNRFAFSTKIPDMLVLGIPTLFYGSDEFAFIRYLLENGIHFVARNENELRESLKLLLLDGKRDLSADVDRSIDLAKRNHSAETNALKFKQIVLQTINRLPS